MPCSTFFYTLRRFTTALSVTIATGLASGSVLATDIVVTGAWVRATVPAQKSTGAFLNIVAPKDAALIGASSPAAGITELHTMRTISGIMRMRLAKEVALPANQTVSLQPGGTHVMLMELKEPLTEGQFVPLTIRVRHVSGETESISLEVPVKPITTR